MKKKELKKIAEQLAQCELILQNNNASSYDKQNAREKILDLTRRVTDLEDMMLVDDYVQEYLQKI